MDNGKNTEFQNCRTSTSVWKYISEFKTKFWPKYFIFAANGMKILRHLGPGGAGGARAPPRIEILLSKNFQNGQNFIFLLFGPPLRKNRSQGPVYDPSSSFCLHNSHTCLTIQVLKIYLWAGPWERFLPRGGPNNKKMKFCQFWKFLLYKISILGAELSANA